MLTSGLTALKNCMSDLRFELDWMDPEGARGPELRATWARLSVFVDGQPISRVYDANAQTVRDGIFIPLYPLAEWLVSRWWQMLYEVHTPNRRSLPGYERRHLLADGREGFALPHLLIEPQGESVRLRWSPAQIPHSPLEFVSSGNVYCTRSDLVESLSELVSKVVARLDALEIANTQLQEEWASIQDADEDELAFCRAAGALGLDPFAVNAEEAEAIVRAGRLIPPELADEFFGSVDTVHLIQQSERISGSLRLIAQLDVEVAELNDLRGEFAGGADQRLPPWERGYQVARQLRGALGLDSQPIASGVDLASALHVDADCLDQLILDPPGDLVNLDAVVGYNDEKHLGFVIGQRRDVDRRFSFCRGLFEHVTSHRAVPALVTKARTEAQKRNRAFAAEFLVPASALRDRLESELIAEEDLDLLAGDFGVSTAVVRHQLENHKIARVQGDA